MSLAHVWLGKTLKHVKVDRMHKQLNWSLFPLFCISKNKRQGGAICRKFAYQPTQSYHVATLDAPRIKSILLQEKGKSWTKRLQQQLCMKTITQSFYWTGWIQLPSKQIPHKLPCSSSVLDNRPYTFWSDWIHMNFPFPSLLHLKRTRPVSWHGRGRLEVTFELVMKMTIFFRCDCPRYHWSMKTLSFMQKWEEKMRFGSVLT